MKVVGAVATYRTDIGYPSQDQRPKESTRN